MSIYGSTVMFADDEHADHCGKWVHVGYKQPSGLYAIHNDGTYSELRDDRACTCKAGPIAYQGSHILPSDDDPRAGDFDLAEIPGFITRDGRDDRDEDSPWPWLRVGADDGKRGDGGVVLLLDVHQVREVWEYLGSWLERVGT